MSTSSAQDPFSLGRKRAPRRSAEEVRSAMLDHAIQLVEARGLTVSLQHISMDGLIANAGLARSAVYRVWPTKEDFFDDLIMELAKAPESAPSVFDEATLVAALDVFETERAKDPQFLLDKDERRRVLVEVCRVGAGENYKNIIAKDSWRSYIALSASVLSYDKPRREQLERAIEESEAVYIAGMAAFYEKLGELLGVKVRPEFRSDAAGLNPSSYMAATGSALMDGMVLRHTTLGGDLLPNLRAETVPCDPFDTKHEAVWNAATLSFTSMLLAMTERIPDAEYQAIDPDEKYREVLRLVGEIKENAQSRHRG